MLTKMPDRETSVLIILSFHILSTLINNQLLWFVVLVRMWIVLFITKLLYDWTVMIYFRNRQVLLKFLNLCYLILSSPSLKQNSDITGQFRWNVNSFHGKESNISLPIFFSCTLLNLQFLHTQTSLFQAICVVIIFYEVFWLSLFWISFDNVSFRCCPLFCMLFIQVIFIFLASVSSNTAAPQQNTCSVGIYFL